MLMLLFLPVDAYSTDDAEMARMRAALQTSTLLHQHLNASVMQVELRHEAQVIR
jgi:hypothetical protein